MRCQAKLHLRRPDRGPELRCGFRAKWYVPGYDLYVCGHHARAYLTAQAITQL